LHAAADPAQAKSSLRPHREPQGVGSHPCEATDLCSQLDRLRELDAVGNRGFSGAANAARGRVLQGAAVLILMGDWCAAAQPFFENQVCDALNA
jgi:hypothetical protein